MKEDEISYEMIVARFSYDSAAGRLIWKFRPVEEFNSKNSWAVWNSRYSGKYAGRYDARGRLCIQVYGRIRKASRIIWMHQKREWPVVIDHIDGNPSNDRLDNLRSVTQAENNCNRKVAKSSKTGVTGVFCSDNQFVAQISKGGVRHYLWTFKKFEDAVAVRKSAEVKFGFHPNHGRRV